MIKYSDTRHNVTLSHDVGLRAFGAQARMLVFTVWWVDFRSTSIN